MGGASVIAIAIARQCRLSRCPRHDADKQTPNQQPPFRTGSRPPPSYLRGGLGTPVRLANQVVAQMQPRSAGASRLGLGGALTRPRSSSIGPPMQA
ncbi:hypothetical protein PCL_07949 [Purpureocillium lilacinum]|uniref:Uncharacterized protein n=2 Tax=Purpureocillium lilacinum TaxID=33203 RepID=A0ACC4E8H2_PURLI|nr:hypothetical protein PCL_07949 [Purpureocillium lilacinum]